MQRNAINIIGNHYQCQGSRLNSPCNTVHFLPLECISCRMTLRSSVLQEPQAVKNLARERMF